jgi:TonB family protein
MRVLQAILLSLLIHFFLAVIVEELPIPAAPTGYNVEVQFSPEKTPRPSQNEKNKAVVRQALVPEKFKVKESADKLKFLSEHLQRVKEQTRAAQSGLTQNRSNSAKAQPQKSETPKSVASSPNRRDSILDPYSSVQAHRGQTRPSERNPNEALLEQGFSTISESVDVAVGKITALNTDQYLFYSFFNRVGDLIYNRWEHLVKNAVITASHKLTANIYRNRYVTTVDIWVEKTGEYKSAHIMKESGINEFDQAAVVAFQQARFFPNPPQELVEDDGLIHLRYDLEVTYDPKALVTK